MKVKQLLWDSTFFDQKVGELDIDGSIKNLISIPGNFDLIYVNNSEDTEITLAKYHCSFSEKKVVFEKTDLSKNDEILGNIRSVFDGPYCLPTLYELAEESGKYSRFHLDPKFSEIYFRKMYHTWIDNSLSGSFADGFLVCEIASEIVGFVTYRTYIDYAAIGLIAINQMHQGKGIGRQLIFGVENNLIDNGINVLRISTQLKNEQACNFYKKLGYSHVETTQIKHFWHDPL